MSDMNIRERLYKEKVRVDVETHGLSREKEDKVKRMFREFVDLVKKNWENKPQFLKITVCARIIFRQQSEQSRGR